MATLAVLLELLISSNLLTWVGVPYVTDGGPIILKFHPGTGFLAFAWLSASLIGGKPWLERIDATLSAFFVFITFCVAYVFLLTGPSNLIVLLDTFLPAGLLAAVMSRAPQSSLIWMRNIMQMAFVMNALCAIGESAAQANLVPLYLNDAVYHPQSEDFRPTAFFDHPLTGALMMMIGLALAPRGRSRRVYQALMWTALIAFGGRMAIGVSVLSIFCVAAATNARLLLVRDRRVVHAGLVAVAGVIVGLLLLAAAFSLGLGERLVAHLYWDESAQVRLAQWQILDQLDGWQWVFGASREELLASLNVLRLSSGVGVIENFWLLMFVSLGLIGFPSFLAMLGSLCVWCWRRSETRGRMLLMSVLVVASSSNSLGRKSTVLVCLVAAISCMREDRKIQSERRVNRSSSKCMLQVGYA